MKHSKWDSVVAAMLWVGWAVLMCLMFADVISSGNL